MSKTVYRRGSCGMVRASFQIRGLYYYCHSLAQPLKEFQPTITDEFDTSGQSKIFSKKICPEFIKIFRWRQRTLELSGKRGGIRSKWCKIQVLLSSFLLSPQISRPNHPSWAIRPISSYGLTDTTPPLRFTILRFESEIGKHLKNNNYLKPEKVESQQKNATKGVRNVPLTKKSFLNSLPMPLVLSWMPPLGFSWWTRCQEKKHAKRRGALRSAAPFICW